MPIISACVCYRGNSYALAVCHGTKASLVKAKILSINFLDINPKNIHIIYDSVEINAPADDIINQCLDESMSRMSEEHDKNDILEVVYFGDVNLTAAGKPEYPFLLINKDAFASMMKRHFPNSMVIKRILVSGDQPIVDDAKTQMALIGRSNLELPAVIDSFINKSDTDLYSIIHQIDVGLIDAILQYHLTFPSHACADSVDDFSEIERCIEHLLETSDSLLSSEERPSTFHFINALQKSFKPIISGLL